MKRAAFIGWSAASVAVWLVVAFAITRFTYAHTYFEIPMWFREAITSLWLRFEPDYNPDALDMENAAALVLFIAAHQVSALVVMPLGMFGWRRIRRSFR